MVVRGVLGIISNILVPSLGVLNHTVSSFDYTLVVDIDWENTLLTWSASVELKLSLISFIRMFGYLLLYVLSDRPCSS